MDLKTVLEQFSDFLAPRLDTYEQAIYIFVLRQGRLQGLDEVTIGFKSARRRIALGSGVKGQPISETAIYEKVRSLESKGCIKVVGSERGGTRLKLMLPAEIEGVIPAEVAVGEESIEEMDFFGVAGNRIKILEREGRKCFYCLRDVNENSFVVEHVVRRRISNDDTYRNVVAACRSCNNRKSDSDASDFLRMLYREGLLDGDEFRVRMEKLELLKNGGLRPAL